MTNSTDNKQKKTDVELHDGRVIRQKFIRFMGYFGFLSIITLMSMYLFISSYTVQKDNIERDITAYKEILNKQQILKLKIDSIYNQMSMLNAGKVKNDMFLGNFISKNLQDTRNLIGKDSASTFKHYSYLITKLDSILLLKNEITKVSDKERLTLKDLNECMGKVSQLKSELSKDPTRGFH